MPEPTQGPLIGWNAAKFEPLFQEWLNAHPDKTLTDFATAARISVSELHRLRRVPEPGEKAIDLGVHQALRVARVLKQPIGRLIDE